MMCGQVQPYTLNGKVAFERADPLGRGDTDRTNTYIHILYLYT